VREKSEVSHSITQVLIHDIHSSLSALQGAIELISDEWQSNPELVEKILPLTVDKINQLQHQLKNFQNQST
jgi:nitrogen-specific signal transduction histidine kinase